MAAFMYFIFYSFIGFLIETIFTLVTKGVFKVKKCFIINYMCPVYGAGALFILLSTYAFKDSKILTFIIGSCAATVIEFIFGVYYSTVLNARVWDYSDLPLNIGGHVSLLYSFFWGILSLILVYIVHPFFERNIGLHKVPKNVFICIFAVILLDFAFSSFMMKKYGTAKALSIRWLINH